MTFSNDNMQNIKLRRENRKPRQAFYTKEYSNMSTHERHKALAERASGKGTLGYCWWVERWLKKNPIENAYKV